MKRSICMCLVLMNVISAAALAQQWEVTGALENFFPSDDLWDSYALGGELKAVYWTASNWGIAVAGGYTQWDIDTATEVVNRNLDLGTTVTHTWDGDVGFIPVGVSALMRFGVTRNTRINGILEAGVRYMFCDSNINVVETTTFVSDDPDTARGDVDCDDGIVGRIGGGLEWALSDSYQPTKLLLTGGYQFDLDKAKATNRSFGISEDLKLNAFFVEIGLVIPIR